MSKRSGIGILAFGVLALCWAPLVGEKNSGEPDHDNAVVSELLELRKSVGGSVLEGTSLEPSAQEQEDAFRIGVQRAATEPPLLPAAPPRLSKNQSEENTVTMLRKCSARLDRIANDIEPLREYHNADELRDMATALRLLARRMDSTPNKKTASKSAPQDADPTQRKH